MTVNLAGWGFVRWALGFLGIIFSALAAGKIVTTAFAIVGAACTACATTAGELENKPFAEAAGRQDVANVYGVLRDELNEMLTDRQISNEAALHLISFLQNILFELPKNVNPSTTPVLFSANSYT